MTPPALLTTISGDDLIGCGLLVATIAWLLFLVRRGQENRTEPADPLPLTLRPRQEHPTVLSNRYSDTRLSPPRSERRDAPPLSLPRRRPGIFRGDGGVGRAPGEPGEVAIAREPPPPSRDRAAVREGTNFPLLPGHLKTAVARRGPLTAALYFWPTLSAQHLDTARTVLDQVCAALRDRLGIGLNLLPPTNGRLVQGDPARHGLARVDPCGAYAHTAGIVPDIAIVFKALQDVAGQPVSDYGGVTPTQPAPGGAVSRFANVDVSAVLAGATSTPEEKLHHVLLHAILGALARQPTKHPNPSWSGVFLVPSPNCDREYSYPSAYGDSPEERARADAEGWKHYNEAILSGTAIRYVPFLDGARIAPAAPSKS